MAAKIFRMGGGVAHTTDGANGAEALAFRKPGASKNPGGDKNFYLADSLTPITFHLNSALAATGLSVFRAVGTAWRVVSIESDHQVAESTAATLNLKVERCQGTEAIAAGDDLLAATDIDMKATVNTAQAGTVLTASGINVLAVGDRLCVHAAVDAGTATATTEFRGQVTIMVRPETLTATSTT